MSQQTWEELLFRSTAAATAIANSSAETILVPDSALPVGYWYAGRVMKCRLAGIVSNIVTTPGTLTLRTRIGGVAGTLLAASAALSLNIVAQTNDQWEAEFYHTCWLEGASGAIFTSGKAFLGDIVAASVGQVSLIPTSGNAAVTGLSLAGATSLSYTAQFSVANSGNSIAVQQFTLESLD